MRSMLSIRNLSGLAFALAAGALSAQTVTVVNMVPRSLSGETRCDAEPSIAVNPANPLQMAGSAFTPNPAGGSMAPYYVSTDGGNTWTLNAVMPGGAATSDVSLRFGSSSNVLYAGILRSDNFNLNILRTSGFSLTTPMTILLDRANDDQPFLDARTVSGADRVYIGNNNFNASSGHTGSIDFSTNAATAAAPAGFSTTSIEKRGTVCQDGPSVRAASAPDGRAYGAFLGWRSGGSGPYVSDVVVVRDDAGGTGSTKFGSLIGSDGLAGTKVATGQNMTFNSTLGTNRAGSSLSIAVDPTDSLTVYVAWGEDGTGGGWTLHLRRSIDGGATWSSDLRTIVAATNPAIAINSNGMVGFFYQKLTSGVWNNKAEFAPKNDPFTSPTTIVLANLPDNSTGTCGQPTIGDYSGMMALGTDFYGVFSGSNTPDATRFPNGITYQRQANWSTKQLLGTNGTTVVSASIDPFFFHIGGLGGPVNTVTASIPTPSGNVTIASGTSQSFVGSATDSATGVTWTYAWTFGDGGTASTASASHTYTNTGTANVNYTATFKATDNTGAFNTATRIITVQPAAVINTPPSITSQPASVTVTAPTAATFSVGATGTAPFSYQWSKNGSPISGAVSSSYTTPATAAGDSGSTFSVLVSNPYGSATSTNATLTVNTIGGTFPEVEANNTIATANVVGSSFNAIQGNLTVATDLDYYALTLTAGQKVTINMTGPSGPDWDLYLKNSAGTTLASSAGSTTSESLTYTNTGTTSMTVYPEVIVYSGVSSTPYNLALTYVTPPPPITFYEVEANGTIATANAVPDNATGIVGYVGATGDNDYFKLNVAPGKTLKVVMTGPTGTGYDYDLYFYNAAGTQLASSLGSTTSETASWANTGTTTAVVYVAVKQYAGSSTTTPYNLAVTR